MTEAVLGFRIDSEPAKAAAADLDKLEAAALRAEKAAERAEKAVASLGKVSQEAAAKVDKGSTATGQFEKKLVDTDRATAKVERTTVTATAAIEKMNVANLAAAAAMAKAVAERDRLNASGAAQKGGAEAAYLEKIEGIIRGTEKGNLFADDVVAGLARAKAAFDAQTISLNDNSRATTAADKAMDEMANGLNSVVDDALNASDVLGDSGLGGVVGDLILSLSKTALPAAAAGLAFTVASNIAQAAWKALTPELKSVDDIIRQHEQNIRRLGPAYAEAAGKGKKYATESVGVVNILLKVDAQEASKRLDADVAKALQGMKTRTSSAGLDLTDWLFDLNSSEFGRGMLQLVSRVSAEFKPFESIIERVEAGKISILEARTEAENFSRANPALEGATHRFLAMTDAAANTAVAISGLPKEVDPVADAFSRMQTAIDSTSTKVIQDEFNRLKAEAESGRLSVDSLHRQIQSLSGARPDMSGAIDEFGLLTEAAIAARNAIGQVSLAQGLLDGNNFSGTTAGVKGGRVGSLTAEERAAQMEHAASQFREQMDMARRFGSVDFGNSAKPSSKKSGGAGKRASDRVSEFDRDISQIRERTASIEAESKVVGLSTFAAEKYLATQRLENAARSDAIGLSPARIAAIDAESTAYARQVAAMEASQDAQRRAEEGIQFARDTARGFASDIISGLEGGKTAWEAFGDAAVNALGKIADKLLDQAFDQLFGIGGSGGGGLLSLLGGGGLNVFPGGGSLNSTGGLWAKGGAFEGGISGHSNTVVNRATPFMFANGAGIMGEAGPEAIMPLRRDSSGRLGVMAANDGVANNNQQPAANQSSRVLIELSPDLIAKILEQSGSQSVQIVRANNAAQENRYQNGAAR